MQKDKNSRLIYSASDLVNFLLCPAITLYDLENIETPLEKTEDDPYAEILQQKGIAHEKQYLNRLIKTGCAVADITATAGDSIPELVENTVAAMTGEADIIFQACLHVEDRIGHIDFFEKVDKPSRSGRHVYEVTDTKLSKKAVPKHIIQLCFYSELLEYFQGTLPEYVHLELGDGRRESFYLQDYYAYYKIARSRYERFLSEKPTHYPIPCSHCGYCSWRQLCKERWTQDDHLSLVANIRKVQIKKLEDAGIKTLAALGSLPEKTRIPGMQSLTLQSLREQAGLQLKKRKTGQKIYQLLPVEPETLRGFNRLPEPDPGELYFVMEGDPLEDDGLEYLFGIYFNDNGHPVFKDFWAHDKKQEKKAFESFIDFVWSHLKKHPAAHIYHYGHYEETAQKNLMSEHGTREFQVDQLLRNHTLVDLYKVVKQGLRISETSYSLKNVENFYMEKREAEVVNAVESIIFYEKWKLTRNPAILDSIRDYNEDDCRSTYLLHKWLLSIKPASACCFFEQEVESIEDIAPDSAITEYEQALAEMRDALTENLSKNREEWRPDDALYNLTSLLLDFYRRADKPTWWALFSRMEMNEQALIDDPECIGGMTLCHPPHKIKRSFVYTYAFPAQEYKLREGQKCTQADTGMPLSDIQQLDSPKNRVVLKMGMTREQPPERLSIGPGPPINNRVLKQALFRFAESLVDGTRPYQAVEQILKKAYPVFRHIPCGGKIIDTGKDLIHESIHAVANLDHSYLSIQGPPGAGKTYTAAHIILALLSRGKKVGVSSNSHKAISNLLGTIEIYAHKQGVTFTGIKKCSFANDNSFLNGSIIADVTNNEDAMDESVDLVGGTVWFFADQRNDQRFDYLFVDEVGQVSLANIVAMGVSAKNMVLLGDQMQLGQPIQGRHPEDTGESVLDYLMDEYPTVLENRGIFLPKTYRMHPDITRFISEVSYNGRLTAETQNAGQGLILQGSNEFNLPETGIRFIPCHHDACVQSSIEETDVIRQLISWLKNQSYRNKTGDILPVTLDDMLIVAPYNMQVNLLQKELPPGARVGTVDKFQGQEAEIVIVSMTTSSQEYLPRHKDFLFSRKRLNVVLSRARCLAILIANPRLLETACNTIEQMWLINTLCRAYIEKKFAIQGIKYHN